MGNNKIGGQNTLGDGRKDREELTITKVLLKTWVPTNIEKS